MAGFDGGTITSDAGALLLGLTDRVIELVGRFARCFVDTRHSELIEHEVKTLVGQRPFALALGYEDLNDHDELRHDPVLAVLDLDATDSRLHGNQEGRFFYGYCGYYGYLPLYVFCGDHLLCAKLRPANIDAAAGSVEEITRIVRQLRERCPKVRIVLSADSGFAREALMAWCETNAVDYLFGLAAMSGWRGTSGLNWRKPEETVPSPAGQPAASRTSCGPPARAGAAGAGSWPRPSGRNEGQTRASSVTSLDAAAWPARSLYEDLYCARGEMEMRVHLWPEAIEAFVGLLHDTRNFAGQLAPQPSWARYAVARAAARALDAYEALPVT